MLGRGKRDRKRETDVAVGGERERETDPVDRERGGRTDAVGPELDQVIEAAFRELTGAEIVAFGGVGIASTVLPVTEAYRVIERLLPEQGEQLQPRLTALLAGASPAGRVYAATLLDRLDPEVGRSAWAALRADPAGFTLFSGCVIRQATIAEYAAGYLR
ncbi:hypothetical protein V6U90_17400 [Micromonospora sp. CPCC 206060]|uniref:hypothetical protein n=1 Tax=Micromonospora sp. CPCC 206060 TaxID=3122406 RepID=UPI002FF11A38